MREIVYLGAGGCGNRISCSFWEKMFAEHAIDVNTALYIGNNNNNNNNNNDNEQLENIGVYFNEVEFNTPKYVPRCILIDSEHDVLDSIKRKPLGRTIQPNKFITTRNGISFGHNFSKGRYSDEARDIVNLSLEAVRREVELCDSFQGFQLCNSLGEGTGSGVTCSLVCKLREEYQDKMIHTFSMFPSGSICDLDVVVEPYNCILSLNQLIENANAVFCFDRQTLFEKMENHTILTSTGFFDFISTVMSGATSSFRFGGGLNNNMRKFSTNLIPFPRLNFLNLNFAPSFNLDDTLSVDNLLHEVWHPKSSISTKNYLLGKCLSSYSVLRGKVSQYEVEDCMQHFTDMNSTHFVEWIPDSVQSSVFTTPQHEFKRSATLISNSTSISQTIQPILAQFIIMFKRKAFIHYWEMEELEFTEAEYNTQDLLNEYQQYETHP